MKKVKVLQQTFQVHQDILKQDVITIQNTKVLLQLEKQKNQSYKVKMAKDMITYKDITSEYVKAKVSIE